MSTSYPICGNQCHDAEVYMVMAQLILTESLSDEFRYAENLDSVE